MRILVQWARASPRGWEELEADAWRGAPSKPIPEGGEVLDDEPGWIVALCVQGVIFQGHDHYAVEPAGAAVRVACWSDDPDDHPEPFGEVWTFHPPGPDPALGGRLNTRQLLELYTPDGTIERPVETTGGRARVRRFSAFSPPAAAVTRHGMWLPDPLYEAHQALLERRGWEEWA